MNAGDSPIDPFLESAGIRTSKVLDTAEWSWW
jgi:hypothetical protein